MCSRNTAGRDAGSCSPTAYLTSSMRGTSAISVRRASEGDLLVVAIHSDASARKLKGEGRPILTERARSALVAALSAVDYVIVFDEAHVEPLLREFQPEVHARGTDGASDAAGDADLAALLGIRVAVVGNGSPHSTSGLVARLRRDNND